MFLLCDQGNHLVCAKSAAIFFQHRSPQRSASFIAQTPLFSLSSVAAAGTKLEDVDVTGMLADFSVVQEVTQRMSIAAVSIFYSQVRRVNCFHPYTEKQIKLVVLAFARSRQDTLTFDTYLE